MPDDPAGLSAYRVADVPFLGADQAAGRSSAPRSRSVGWRSFPPAGFIIGAQKAGTTTLAAMLDQHPQIAVARQKEPDFFHVNWDRGIEWYRTCFREPRDILLDASPSYTMAPPDDERVPARIFALQPLARFIYLVRDPAERCHSAYWHEVRSGRERRTLRDAVTQQAYYVHASYYYRQLTGFLRYFPLERFLFVPFDDLTGDPIATAARCARFLGVTEADFQFRDIGAKNQGFQYNRFGRFAQDRFGEGGLRFASRLVSRLLPHRLHPPIKRAITQDIPALSDDDRIWLSGRFSADAFRFERLTGLRPTGAQEA